MEKLLFILLHSFATPDPVRLSTLVNDRREPRSVYLLHDGRGGLSFADAMDGRHPFLDVPAGWELAGLLHWVRHDGEGAWYLLRCSQSLALDDMAPPLSLAHFDPGSVLSIGAFSWLIARVWTAEQTVVPEQFADKACPVCSGALSAAPVVRCRCGRMTHLEHGDEPDDPQALNCFLQAGTCECGWSRAPSKQLA